MWFLAARRRHAASPREERRLTAHAHDHDHAHAHAHGSADTEGRVARAADRVGAVVGFLCALHCALVPLLLGVLPALGLGFLAGLALELALLAVAGVVAAVAVVHAVRRHRGRGVVGGLVVGFALLVAGVLVEDQHLAHAPPDTAPTALPGGSGSPALHAPTASTPAAGDHDHGPGEHNLVSTLLSIAGGLLLAVSHVRNSRVHVEEGEICEAGSREASCGHCPDHAASHGPVGRGAGAGGGRS